MIKQIATTAASNAAQSLGYRMTNIRKKRGVDIFKVTIETLPGHPAELNIKHVIYELKYRMQRYGIEDFEHIGGDSQTAYINISINN